MTQVKKNIPSPEYLSERFPKDYPVILFDAGHGGIIGGEYQTSGKRSPKWDDGRQLFEGEFNRDIVARIMIMMNEHNFPFVDVVNTLEDKPLRERTKTANKYFHTVTEDCILCSIHANAGGGTGHETFTSPGLTDSDAYAEVIIKHLVEGFPELRLRKDDDDGDNDKEAKFWMVTKTEMPAFLIECAFMDTKYPDCELMLSEDGRQRFAEAIFSGLKEIILNYKAK